MRSLEALFQKYPEMGVYLAVGIGYLIGRLKLRGVGLGIVTGSLIAGILIGNFFYVPVSDQAKAMLFLLFLFGIGYSVGPSFFQSFKGDGWRWAILAVFVPVAGLAAAYVVARVLKLDVGYSAGLLSGALTESPAIGTASEAIRGLALAETEKQQLIGHIAVADAVCYLFGTLGVIWCCASLGPKILRINLRSESKKLEQVLGIEPAKPGVFSAWQPIGFRAYAVTEDSRVAGKTVVDAESSVSGARIFIERIRRGTNLFAAGDDTVLQPGDTIAVIGRTEIMVKVLGPHLQEMADPELLNIPVASSSLYLTNKSLAGRTLREVVEDVREARGVLLRSITRGEHSVPIGGNTVLERGDTLSVLGSESAVNRLGPLVGTVIQPVEESDLAVLGIAIFLGVLAGALIAIPVGGLKIALGTSVGTLLAGVIVGWMRSVRPLFGRLPDDAVLFMKSLGLAAFVAMVGLKAGPLFVSAVKQYGFVLFGGGIVVTLMPLILGMFLGRYILRLNPVLLLGGLAGAQTMIAGVAAMEEKSDSSVATLGYSYTAAIGHILLTTWGTVLVYLLS